ncbi:MAG: UDP-N-acetylmuramoyl-L-alanine--D-glutamate ligase [Massiliimalia sp.]
MQNSISLFFESLKGKKIYFIGMGVTNFGVIKQFREKGLDTTVCDKKSCEELAKAYPENYVVLKELGVQFITGADYLEHLKEADVIFRTPGMNYNTPALQKAREQGIVVTSEMETFFDLCPCKIYAVTGSDGKTTTTTLISEMLKAEGHTVHLGGNIGKALLPMIEDIRETDVAVVELSSFQLISMRQSPNVAVITNVAPNHLDVHKDMQEYIDAKTNLIRHQNAFSRTVLNWDNEITRNMTPLVRGKVSYFSRREKPFNGTWLNENGELCRVVSGEVHPIIPMNEIRIPGIHNVENYLTAIAAVGDQVSDDTIRQVARNFGGVEHRIEWVRNLDGVDYYNDSIATSPTRTIAGLNSFSQKLIVIAGGYDKKIPYEPLAPYVNEKVKILILLGATAPKIEKAVTEHPSYDPEKLQIVHANTLEEAVEAARKLAKPGDVVTLSPASASFDLYLNFEQRGNHYKSIVNGLK